MKRRARLGSHGLLHSVQAIDAGGLAGSCPQPGHIDAESSRDYDIQQQPAEIDIATIMGGVFLGALRCMCTHAAVQLFPGRAVSRNGHPLGVTCLSRSTPDPASRPHARRLVCPRYLSRRTGIAEGSLSSCQGRYGLSDPTQGDRHLGEIRPHSFVGILACTWGASAVDAVTSKPIQRIAWQVGAISARITLQVRTCPVRRAWGDGVFRLSWMH